ncbi:WD40 repeat domain-containing protein [Aggregatibacter aphrophilus]|uniref:WD40 repeat domain-containing protein n=1 Tax=Aggregatibacter aphrophilus TaxID=732 RepID=UPI000D6E7014|nr:WD40 repeat domain-containing protein [Aggregatibacter aphrophilus]
MKSKLTIISFIVATTILLVFFRQHTDPVISLSVSTDGRYVISAHVTEDADRHKPIGQLVLWDIEKKEKTILARNANAFSAFFIPDSHQFMWQDNKNIVHIQNVEGKEIENFPHFQVKTHIMSADKQFYLSSNMEDNGQLYKGYGKDLIPVYTDGSFPFPLTLSMSKDYFLSATETCTTSPDPVADTNLTINPVNPDSSKKSSYTGVTLWDRYTLKPVARLYGNCGYTTGLISPNGDWVVTGGENFGNYMWEIHNIMNRQRLSLKFDNIPEKLQEKQITKISVIAYAFVTDTEFVAVRQSGNYDGYGDEIAAVYTVGEPQIKGYVEIGNDPSISTNYYQRNLSVSSSPKAHILVTGQATGGGINVYKYHPEKMELEKIWVAD